MCPLCVAAGDIKLPWHSAPFLTCLHFSNMVKLEKSNENEHFCGQIWALFSAALGWQWNWNLLEYFHDHKNLAKMKNSKLWTMVLVSALEVQDQLTKYCQCTNHTHDIERSILTWHACVRDSDWSISVVKPSITSRPVFHVWAIIPLHFLKVKLQRICTTNLYQNSKKTRNNCEKWNVMLE